MEEWRGRWHFEKKKKSAAKTWSGGEKLFWECEERVGGEKKLLAKVEAEAMRRGDNSRLRELKA